MTMSLTSFAHKTWVFVAFASHVSTLLLGAASDDGPVAAELSRMGCEVHTRLVSGGLMVERVDFRDGLSDDLFVQLRKLRHLSALNLWLPNEHSGSPCLRGLVALRGLRDLALTGPDVDDHVAQYIGTMTNLESLEMLSISMSETGLVRLGNLKALKRFKLSDLKPITQRGLTTIATLTNLEEILIAGNCDKGALLELKSLEKLAVISIGGTYVDDQLAELRTLPSIKTVKISRATITPATADSLLAMHNLESLDLGCCDIEPEAARRMQSLRLKRLDCYGADSSLYEQLLKGVGSNLWDLHAASAK